MPEIEYTFNEQGLLEIKEVLDNASINFLVGSGFSSPLCSLLDTDTEDNLGKAENDCNNEQIFTIKKKIFNEIIEKNTDILNSTDIAKDVQEKYVRFLKSLNSIITLRKNNLLHRQINIFTSNYDMLFEMALETLGLDYNDGFTGRFSTCYNSENFKKSVFKRGMFLDSASEIPIFNLIKIHGSVSWGESGEGNDIITLETRQSILGKLAKIKGSRSKQADFLAAYKTLNIINPSGRKFLDTVLLDIYSDLLRIYTSELEKFNSVLFVCGFSLRDQHIRRLTLKAANANPTLKIYIFAYDKNDQPFIRFAEEALNNNVKIFESNYSIAKTTAFFDEIRKISGYKEKNNESRFY